MINQNTHQIIHGHGGNGGGPFVLPLSPDPSSIAIPDRQMGGTSSENEDEDDTDDDEEDDGHSTMAYDRPRSVSAAPLPLPTSQQASKESAQHSMQYAQALVALTTENATLKTRLKKLEQVVQVLLGMNNGGAVPVTNPTMGLDILSLLGPDQPAQTAGGEFGTIDPSTNLPPRVSPSDISPALPISQTPSRSNYPPTDNFLPALALPLTETSSTSPPLNFPTTENKDHARHPAAMTTVPELARGPALQRACFSSPARKVREARERESKSKEQEEMRNKVECGLKRVLEWRSRCLPREVKPEDLGRGTQMGTLISSVG